MRGRALSVDVALESLTRQELPANCESLARLYVGDVEHQLARAPKNRALFLIGPSGAWRLDVGQLVAKFADGVRALERARELELGIAWPRPLHMAKASRGKRKAS